MRGKPSLILVTFRVQLAFFAENLVSGQTVIALEARVVKETPASTVAPVSRLSVYHPVKIATDYAPFEIRHGGTHFLNDANTLMPKNHVQILHMQVRATQACMCDFDENFVIPKCLMRLRLDNLPLAGTLENLKSVARHDTAARMKVVDTTR